MTVPDDDKGKEPDSIDEFIGIDEEFSKWINNLILFISINV